jgi:hypothetical protein
MQPGICAPYTHTLSLGPYPRDGHGLLAVRQRHHVLSSKSNRQELSTIPTRVNTTTQAYAPYLFQHDQRGRRVQELDGGTRALVDLLARLNDIGRPLENHLLQ